MPPSDALNDERALLREGDAIVSVDRLELRPTLTLALTLALVLALALALALALTLALTLTLTLTPR